MAINIRASNIKALARSAAAAALSLVAVNALAEPVDWQAAARADIIAAHRITAANHPGMVDPANPRFPALLEEARDEALRLAAKVSTAGGYEAVLGRFSAVLADGHAGAYATLPEAHATKLRWPRFVAAWRGEAMYVYKSAPGGPPEGARIVRCDGQGIRDRVAADVFRFEDGGQLPGKWWSRARLLFVDDGNPFVKRPRACLFEKDGKKLSQRLTWEAVPSYYAEWRNGSANGDLLPIGLVERAPGLHWVALPDFSPDAADMQRYQQLYADLAAKRDALRSARAVVLDLRFNTGGSSDWSLKVAEHLWGKARVTRLKAYANRDVQILWRPTPGTVAAVKEFIPLLQAQGNADVVALIGQFVPMLGAAMARGDPLLTEPDMPGVERPTSAVMDAAGDPPPFTAPVFVIVPGQCASACLDAVDVFKLFPNVRLIGAPSSADSTYMEVRTDDLPSGFGKVIIPMKIWVNRPRGNGAFYPPDIMMTGFDWSTDAFRKRIEAEVPPRP
jgi:hypothetical protein